MLPVLNPAVDHRPLQAAGWCLFYLAVAGAGLSDYINWASPVLWLGVLCLLQATVPATGSRSGRFAYFSISFGLASFLLPVKTLLYLSGAAALLFVLESVYGKVRQEAVLTLVVMSPVFQYAANVFSFPFRLQLTGLAARLMQLTGQQIVAEGNTLRLHGYEFTVDPACIGLNMMETSLLVGIMISSFYQRKFRARPRLLTLLLILALITALNILSNLLRIIAIAEFNLLPGTALHDAAGIACLLLYVVLPAAVAIRLVMKHAGKHPGVPQRAGGPATPALLYVLVAGGVVMSAFNSGKHETEKYSISRQAPRLPGYAAERVDAETIKLKGPASLVYVKSIMGFYSTEHNPVIRWSGSGYQFKKVRTGTIRGTTVYMAALDRGGEQLYTAWWYDNATTRTISQLGWRWDVLQGGAAYSLVNVTCASEAELYSSIQEICTTGRLNGLLQPRSCGWKKRNLAEAPVTQLKLPAGVHLATAAAVCAGLRLVDDFEFQQ